MKTSQRWSRNPRNEKGSVRKKWAGRISIALIFPDVYSVGMSNLGLQSVYAWLNAEDRVVTERFFVPNRLWLSEESGRPLKDFDLILFSVSFESNYQNMVKALEAAGLSLRSENRLDQEPIVLAGGIATQINPEPVAPFVDAFLLGDFEAISGAFVSCLPELTDRSLSRTERLKRLADNIPGVYVPSAYRPLCNASGDLVEWEYERGFSFPVVPAVFSPDSQFQIPQVPHTGILSPYSVFPNMFLIELARGCGKGCRFCAAGFVYRPPRQWPIESLNAALQECKDTDRVGLVGLEFLGREEIGQLCRRLLDKGLKLAFSSLRADEITQDLVRLLKASDIRLATIAPEAGSQRLRQVINKNLDEDVILRAAETLVSGGVPNLKLYFMLGLPFETDEDVQGIVKLVDKIRRAVRPAGRARGHMGSVTASISTFVPKAWTPMQWAGSVKRPVLKRRRRILQKGLRNMPNVKLQLDSVREAHFQTILSRGDRRLAPVLEAVALRGVTWSKALKEAALSADMYCRALDADMPFPWEIIGHRVRREYLREEWNKASEGRETAFCIPQVCNKCGACCI
ncbi:MAG: radical SAM protein [Deltaproteobacteria bacterium]|nr:radical SAM protein [Deltaproteobacteria bacterium]MBW1946986.1 radical SAM protein [Deltaproteobacteria bacterium]MBW1966117.1 radical SAM protein [Deltaproteobacteria bacterium]MBW2097364.1 radical SAM protein [Deltaproteobacteria bacterium]